MSALEPASPIQRRAGMRKRPPFLKVFVRIIAIALVLFVLPLLLVAVHEDHDISSMPRIGFREMDTPRLDAYIPDYYAPGIGKEYADSRDIDRARRDYRNFTLDDGTVISNYPVGPDYYLPDPDEIGPFIFCLAIIPPEVFAHGSSGTVSILEAIGRKYLLGSTVPCPSRRSIKSRTSMVFSVFERPCRTLMRSPSSIVHKTALCLSSRPMAQKVLSTAGPSGKRSNPIFTSG